MITVHAPDEKLFLNNGLVVLSDTLACPVTEELNGLYELELEYPIDERGKWKYLVEENIIRADNQPFRIYRKKKNLSSITVNARHIFYDLTQNFLEDVSSANSTGAAALDWVLTNTQYAHNFTNMSDVSGNKAVHFVRKNPVEAILGDEGIVATWGGELVRDNYQIKLLNARGLDRGVLIAYGKNIQGIEETLDIDGLCTRLMPVGKDDLKLPEKYIDSPHIGLYPHPKIRSEEFSSIGVDEDKEITEEMAIVSLRAAATAYMTNNQIDIPQFNYTINFLELSKTEEYKNYSILEQVYMGDTVTVRHLRLGLDLKAKVIRMVKNKVTNRLEEVQLGSFKQNIATGIETAIQEIKSDIIADKSQWQKAVDNATLLLNSALGGFVIKREGELLIMDTDDINTAVKVWRWNINGLGYSSTGYAGPFALAMTMDGRIVASFISGLLGEFVTIRASQIVLGTNNGKIPDGLIAGSSGWNDAQIKAANALVLANNALIMADNALQKDVGYNNTYINQNGVQVRDLYGAEVVNMGALGDSLYGLKVKNASAADVVIMGKIASGLYGIKAFHSDGSYTQLSQNGLERYVNGELKPYHFETFVYESTTQSYTGYGDTDKFTKYGDPVPTYYTNGITIQLPARFKGKNFSAFVVYKSGVMVYQYAKSTTYVEFKVINIDKVNARVTVVGYATCYWDTNEAGYQYDWQNEYAYTYINGWNSRRTTGFEFTLIVTL
jgi:phage minor structural protein